MRNDAFTHLLPFSGFRILSGPLVASWTCVHQKYYDMHIGILSRSGQLYSTQSIFRAGKRRGHTMHLVDHTRCSLILDGDRPNIWYNGRPLHHLDAVIPRIGASVTRIGAAVIDQFETMGVVTSTTSEALLRARDKLRCQQLLVQKGIPTPRTVMVGRYENLHQAVVRVGGYPVVVKMLESTHGVGVELARDFRALQRVARSLFHYEDRLLVQEFVAESSGVDIRALVVDGRVVASMRREAQAGEFRSNLHRGATATTIELNEEEARTVLAVATAMGIKIAGVDLLASARGPLVMEVNASPGLEGIEGTTGVDVADAIIRLVERQVKDRLAKLPKRKP
jgi:ribosomal protein S6--L-glutamate ligase